MRNNQACGNILQHCKVIAWFLFSFYISAKCVSLMFPADDINHSFQACPCDQPSWNCFCFQLWVWFSMWMWIGINLYNKFTVAHLLRSDIFPLSVTHHSCVHACKITSVCMSVLLLNVLGLSLACSSKVQYSSYSKILNNLLCGQRSWLAGLILCCKHLQFAVQLNAKVVKLDLGVTPIWGLYPE